MGTNPQEEWKDHVADAIKSQKRGPVYDESYKLAEGPRVADYPYKGTALYMDGMPLLHPELEFIQIQYVPFKPRNPDQEKRDIVFYEQELGRD